MFQVLAKATGTRFYLSAGGLVRGLLWHVFKRRFQQEEVFFGCLTLSNDQGVKL